MIKIDLGTIEYFDEENNQFHYEEGGVVRFEYSLKALYDWEAKWKKPFLRGEYSHEELQDFFYKMALDPVDIKFLTNSVMEELTDYIASTETATTFSAPKSNQNGNSLGKVYTAEEIYGLMFMAEVPLEFENRNLNRLMVVLRIISSYNQPKEKMDTHDIYEQNRRINEERKKQLGTKG